MSGRDKVALVAMLHFLKSMKGMIEKIYNYINVDELIYELEHAEKKPLPIPKEETYPIKFDCRLN